MGSKSVSNRNFRKKEPENSQLFTASDILQSLLTNGKGELSQQFQRWRLWRKWPEVVGRELAQVTQPVGYKRGTLILWADHPARIQDLHYIREALMIKINSYLGKKWIHNLTFTTDRRSVPQLEEADKSWKDYLSPSDFEGERGDGKGF